MSIKILYKVGALGPGSSLWIIPHLTHSPWSQKINWHLNFQISKMKFLKTQELNSKLKTILKSHNIPVYKKKVTSSLPLLIESHFFLPNSKIVELPSTKTHKEWIDLAHKVWKKLSKPSLRLFLPESFPISEFQNIWPKEVKKKVSESLSISLVPHSQEGRDKPHSFLRSGVTFQAPFAK